MIIKIVCKPENNRNNHCQNFRCIFNGDRSCENYGFCNLTEEMSKFDIDGGWANRVITVEAKSEIGK